MKYRIKNILIKFAVVVIFLVITMVGLFIAFIIAFNYP